MPGLVGPAFLFDSGGAMSERIPFDPHNILLLVTGGATPAFDYPTISFRHILIPYMKRRFSQFI